MSSRPEEGGGPRRSSGRWRAAIPLGLLWTPENVALATLFLASKSSAWITGVTLPICREAGSWSDPKSSMRYSTACKSISDLDRRVMRDQTKELEKLGEDWAAAELRGDTAFLERALADDFVAVGPRGFMLTKEQWLSRHDSGSLKYESFEWDEVQVRVYGDTAVMTGRETAEGRYENQNVRHELREQFRVTLVFVEHWGRWLLFSLHLSFIAGAP